MKTKLQGGFVVAFRQGGHEVLDGGCIVYEADKIIFVGFPDDSDCPEADKTVNATGNLISPGLINLHCIANIDLQPLRLDGAEAGGFPKSKAWFEGTDNVLDDEDFKTSAEFSVAALLRHGTTTFCNVTTMASKRFDDPEVELEALVEASDKLGARAYLAHNFQDYSRYHPVDDRSELAFNPEAGRKGLERAVSHIERLRSLKHPRIQGFLFPYTTETCSDELLKEASRVAKDLGVPMRSHFAQYLGEAQTLLQQRGMSPLERLVELDILGTYLTLTHAIYLRGHPALGGNMDAELNYLAESGTHVAHSPVVYARRGYMLHSFQRYLEAGINLGIGTDTVPPDMLAEMRMASTLSKLADDDPSSGNAAAVFNAATLGGAKALGRNDLGRLEPGATADISVFNLRALHIGVVDDPIKALIHYANGVDTDSVIVHGRTVVKEGRVLGIDEDALLSKAQLTWKTYKEGLAARDPLEHSSAELYPSAFPIHKPRSKKSSR